MISVQVEFLAEKEGETCVVCRSRTEALYITSGNGTLTLFAGKINRILFFGNGDAFKNNTFFDVLRKIEDSVVQNVAL